MTEYTVDTCPPLLGSVVWISGIERRANGAVRVYVGPRYLGRYVLGDRAFAEAAERAFRSSRHAWMRPAVIEDMPLFHEDVPPC